MKSVQKDPKSVMKVYLYNANQNEEYIVVL